MEPFSPLPILYQDEALVAVNKPHGLLVHRTRIDRHETRFALQAVRDQVGRYVYPVHRLDKATSGVLVFAFSSEVARTLSDALSEGRVEKTYLAVVRGWPPESLLIDRPLTDLPDAYGRRWQGTPQPASTRIQLLATVDLPVAVSKYPTSRYALVEASPLTGKQHQIRRHLKHAAHPIVGDGRHGEKRHNRFFASEYGISRLLLAAVELAFTHPVSGQRLCLSAPLDGPFTRLLDRLGWGNALPDRWITRMPDAPRTESVM